MTRPFVEAGMRPLVLVFAASLVACGGASPPAASSAPPGTHWREDLSCHESEPSGQAECEARSCVWQAALVCSGIAQPHEVLERNRRSAPCTCVCHEDLMRCLSVP